MTVTGCSRSGQILSIATNIVRRKGSSSWHARIAVPQDLQDAYKRAELWKSLRTTDVREARWLGADQIAEWQTDFAERRRRRAPSEGDLQAAVWDHYEQQTELDRSTRARLPKAAQFERERQKLADEWASGATSRNDLGRVIDVLMLKQPLAYDREMRARRCKVLADHLATGETVMVHWAADAMIAREGLEIDKGSPAYIDLCQRLQRAELEALNGARSATRGIGEAFPPISSSSRDRFPKSLRPRRRANPSWTSSRSSKRSADPIRATIRGL